MELYLLKSTACLGVFFIFYKAILENTSIHNSKRFYLLGAVVVSFLIPLITFTTYVEVPEMISEAVILTTSTIDVTAIPMTTAEEINYLPYILWSIYSLGVLFFGIKFGKNLFHLISKIKKNPNIKFGRLYHVLIAEKVAPHTFFNHLFFNKNGYEAKEFPKELFWHEEAHATQKHSADLLFLGFLQVVFWFNPLFYFMKSAIKLNHEFLADREVLQKTEDPVQYQQLLLSFSTPENFQEQGLISFANSINYSSIKKRFTVMKTQTSRTSSWIKGLLILPLLCVLIYGFSTTQTIEKIQPIEKANPQDDYATQYMNGANRNNKKAFVLQIELSEIKFNGIPVKLKDVAKTMDAYTKNWIQTDYIEAHPSILMTSTPKEFLDKVDTEFRKTHYSKANSGMTINPPAPILNPSLKRPHAPARLTTGNQNLDEHGTVKINGADYYYRTEGKTTTYYDQWGNTVNATNKKITDKKITSTNWIVQKGEDSNIPPPPPTPDSFFKGRVYKELPANEKNMEFYYKDKLIPRNEAMKLIKNNDGIAYAISEGINNSTIVTLLDKSDLPPPPPTSKRVKKGEDSNIPPPPPTPNSFFKGRVYKELPTNEKNMEFYYKDKLIPRDKAMKLIKNNDGIAFAISEGINNSTIVTLLDKSELPPPPPTSKRVKKGEASNIPPPPPNRHLKIH